MKCLFQAGAGLLLSAALIAGPSMSVKGEYIEARTADVFTGPCFANSEITLTGDTAVLGWHIREGQFEGVKLDGLSVVGVLRGKGTFGDPINTQYPVKSILIVDEKATPEQRIALAKFAKHAGGDLFENVVKVAYEPISFTVANDNIHSRKAELTAGTLAAIKTRAMTEADQICHNEDVYFLPLTKTDHAMPAYAEAHSFKGEGLGMTWSSPLKRSAYVGTFDIKN